MKRVSFEVAKALKEAGYPQGHSKRVYLISAIAEELAYREFGLFPKDYFPGELVGTGSYYKYDIETCDAPKYLEVWLWLWREKGICIDIESYDVGVDMSIWNNKILLSLIFDSDVYYKCPEEAIIAAIEYLVTNKLIK